MNDRVIKAAAVIVAGGRGVRFGAAKPKQFIEIGGKTILQWSIEKFESISCVKEIVVVLPAGFKDEFNKETGGSYIVASGGESRQESVLNGLRKLVDKEIDVVAIHDAARPLVEQSTIEMSFNLAAAENVGALACAPMRDTVKRRDRDGKILETVPRDDLVLAQTPQTFPFGMILDAHERAVRDSFICTDDSSLFEHYGHEVRMVESNFWNLKVTETSDIGFLQYKIDGATMYRIGEGYDLHSLQVGRPLILGGIEIPHHKGCYGHSDADALLHAIADAMLGALSLGDIGAHFPDTDPAYKGADSAILLGRVVEMVRKRGWNLVNLDATIIAQAPKLRPHIDSMRARIAEIIDTDMDNISVKATTNEGLDAIGAEEALAARAIVLLNSSEVSKENQK